MGRYYQLVTLPNGEPNPKRRKRAHKSGPTAKVSKFARGSFIAWDGEGWTHETDNAHVYTMLCNSVETEPLINLRGIPTLECLDYLCTIGAQYPDSVHVAFGAGYDVNMMLADCSRAELERIHAGQWVVLGRKYLVCYRQRKSFSVKRWPVWQINPDTGRRHKVKTAGLVLWDVFGFFQSSFVEACEKYLGADHDGLTEVREQKQRRHDFDPSQILDILHYCQLECRLLVKLMETLRDYLETARLQIRRWDGAGACAAALLQREGILQHRGTIPPDVMRASQHAYAGGRMEVARFGNAHNTPIYHYDINSAYPAAMANVPSLAHGTWRHTTGSHNPNRTDSFALYRIRWRFNNASLYPFFWRAYDGSIFFPREGCGIYWSPEVNAALEAMESGAIKGSIEILDGWEWISEDDVKPFAWIPTLYDQRREWKRAGIGAEKVVKLAINSLYGKTAQHLGGTATDSPRYHRLEWAGYVTSATRAKLYRAATPHIKSRSIIMTATDALYSTEPLDVPCSNKLGEWESHTHDGITVVQSGVYWTIDGLTDSPFCRGFDKGSLDRTAILEAWQRGEVSYNATLTRFVTMGSALAGATALNRWRQWRTVDRRLALTTDGTKRHDEISCTDWTPRRNPSRTLMHTVASVPAAQVAGQLISAPFPLPWIDNGSKLSVYEPTFDDVPLRVAETEAYDTIL